MYELTHDKFIIFLLSLLTSSLLFCVKFAENILLFFLTMFCMVLNLIVGWKIDTDPTLKSVLCLVNTGTTEIGDSR